MSVMRDNLSKYMVVKDIIRDYRHVEDIQKKLNEQLPGRLSLSKMQTVRLLDRYAGCRTKGGMII